ncbi:MAG: hypothetical protein CMM25_01530 [Rhodospirillaceae bacterium]|nr:hypothetical protein [Rhodospirillaceae bacterium]
MATVIHKRPFTFSIKEGASLSIHKDSDLLSDQENYSFNYYYGNYRDNHHGTDDTPAVHFDSNSNNLHSSASAVFSGQNSLSKNIGGLSGKRKVSFSTWYKSFNTEEELLATDTENDSGIFQLYSNNTDDRPQISIYDGNQFFSLSGSKTINDGEWHHLAATINTESKSSQLKLYIDGEIDSSGTAENLLDYTQISGNGHFNATRRSQVLRLTTNTGDALSSRFLSKISIPGGSHTSNLYFANPITNGIDKWRLRYERGSGGNHSETKFRLILQHKISKTIQTSEIQKFAGGSPDPQYRASTGNGYGHIPYPNAIPESGITYKNTSLGHQVFPGTLSGPRHNRSQYPLQTAHNRTPESGFKEEPAHVGGLNSNNGFWSPPRLYGNDWENPQYTDYNIIGIQLNETNRAKTAYLYELGFYLNGKELNIWSLEPFATQELIPNKGYSDFTLGSTAGENQSKYLSGQLDHFGFFNKDLNAAEVKHLYLSGIYDSDYANDLKTSGWYEFSNPSNIGFDSHSIKSTENVVRLYHFNNDLENDSAYSATLTKAGDPIFESGDNSKFGTSSIYLSGQNQRLFDMGGHELTLNEDFTIEFFIKFKSKPENLESHNIIQTKNYAGVSVNYNFSVTQDKFILDIKEGNNDFKTFESVSTSINNDIWYHIVIGRNGNDIIMLKNGAVICKESMPFYLPLDDAEHGLSIGGGIDANIEDFRIIKDRFIYDISNLIIPPTKQLSNSIQKRNTLLSNLATPTTDSIKERRTDALFINRTQYLDATNGHDAFCFEDENFSFCTWVKPTTIEDATVLGVWNESGIKSYCLMTFGADKTFRLLVSADGTSYNNVTSLSSASEILFEDKWYFICGIHDSSSDEIKLYVYDEKDLISLTSKSWDQGVKKDQYNHNFQLNGAKNGMSCATDLHINQLSFFNKPLEVLEVSEIWSEGRGKEYKNLQNPSWKPNIISWFDFAQGSTHDSKNSNHLTSSSSLTLSSGRRSTSFENAQDGAKVLFISSSVGQESLFSPEGREAEYKVSSINSYPALSLTEKNNSGDFLNSTYSLPEHFTVFAALSGKNENEYAPIINNMTSENQGFCIYNSGDSFKIQVNDQSTEISCPANYHTIAATYFNGTGKLFVNGKDFVFVESQLEVNPKPLSVGNLAYLPNDETNNYFNGLISEVIIFEHSEPLNEGTKNYLAQKYRLNKLKIS